MAQGNITQILSSKPDDRRLVFEEAAGITRFKQQKREAIRKLEHTDQNLLRVQDLIREVKRQMGSLQRQAGKARRYRAVQAELQHLETQWARHQYDLLVGELVQREELGESLKQETETLEMSMLQLEDEILQLRERLSSEEQAIAERQHAGMELKAEIDRQESRVGFNQERLKELELQHERAIREVQVAQERKATAESELAGVQERLIDSQSQLGQLRSVLEEKRSDLQQVEKQTSGLQETLRAAQSKAFAAAQQLARIRNELNSLEVQRQGNAIRLEKLRAEQVQVAEERERLHERLQEFEQQFEAEKLSVESCRGTVAERQARLKELQQEIQAASHDLDQSLRKQAEKRSRLQVLQQLDTQHEGFGQGALAALRGSADVLGTLADGMRVPDAHVVAIESALGHHLQVVLTEKPGAAEAILADLQNNKKGRASIAAVALVPSLAEEGVPTDLDPSVAGISALEVVQCDAPGNALVNRLLGRTRIVQDLPMAAGAAERWPGYFDYVTTTGDLLTRHGVFTGGSVQGSGKAAASILGRKNLIAELQTEVASLQEEVDRASRKKGSLQGEQSALQASLEQARTELRQHEVAVATRQGEFNALQTSRRSLEVKTQNVDHELSRLTVQLEESERKHAAMAGQVSDWERAEQEAAATVKTLAESLETIRQQREAAASQVSDAKVALASEEQLCASFERQKSPLEQRLRELTHQIQQIDSEQGAFNEKRARYEQEIVESQSQKDRLKDERQQVADEVASRLEEKTKLEVEIGDRDEQLRQQRTRSTQIQSRRGQIDVEIAQKRMSRDNLVERIQQRYQIELDTVQPEGLRVTVAEDGGVQVETIPLEELEAAGTKTDWDSVGKQVQALQRRIDEMGPVNLVAIEEFEETEQRHDFVHNQYEELVKAKEELVEVINRINTETKALFVETFESIRKNFQTMFVEIFGGGKADLRLVDDGDVLESGIEIVARPPGKQLQSITLLSGGEQTMTAVSLLFAIYQVKPSPFCVLDELDAPLDESNINRFVRVLQRFLEHSQFIVITHNKRTIAMADVLYGVTMQEHGVSRIVSVRFNDNTKVAKAVQEPVGDSEPVPTLEALTDEETSASETEDESETEAGEESEVNMVLTK
jgi:chromosome segregation protein